MIFKDETLINKMEDDFSMDHSMMTIIERLAESRTNFFNTSTIRAIDFASRPLMMNRFLTNETSLLEAAYRTYSTNQYLRQAASTLISFTMPLSTRFTDPVTVTPSAEQLQHAMVNIPETNSSCSICQERIVSEGVRLRHCGHVHHRTCLTNWFAMSVRCPVCRHDIREADPPTQTSSDA